MSPAGRKFALTAHVAFSVGWLGAVAGFVALAVAGLTSQDAQLVRAAYLAMELITWFVIVPLSLASLLTGLVQSLSWATRAPPCWHCSWPRRCRCTSRAA